MTFKQKFLAWVLVVFSYLSTFVTPMIAAYFLLAVDTTSTEGKGGLLFFIIVGIFGGGLVIAVMKLINKQKANMFKTLFRTAIKISVLAGFVLLFKYIRFNLDNLLDVLYFTAGGFLLGAIFEGLSIGFYGDYIREKGVF